MPGGRESICRRATEAHTDICKSCFAMLLFTFSLDYSNSTLQTTPPNMYSKCSKAWYGLVISVHPLKARCKVLPSIGERFGFPPWWMCSGSRRMSLDWQGGAASHSIHFHPITPPLRSGRLWSLVWTERSMQCRLWRKHLFSSSNKPRIQCWWWWMHGTSAFPALNMCFCCKHCLLKAA